MTKPYRSLQFKLSAALFLIGVALITISTLRMIKRGEDSRRERLEALAFSEGSRLSGMAQHLIRRQVSHVMDLKMSYASAHPNLLLGIIVDEKGNVRHSTRQDLRGLLLHETPLANVEEDVALARKTMEGRIFTTAGDATLRSVFPFREGLDESRGCVILEFDLRGPLADGRASALHASIVQGLALGGGCLVLWLLLKVMVTGRVSMLVRQVDDISLDTDPGAALPGEDEISRVSQSISHAHARLRYSEQRLRQITSTMRDVFWLAPGEPGLTPYVNPAYQSVLSQDAARLSTHHWDWLHAISRDDRRLCLERLRQLRAGESVPEFEVRVNTEEGQTRWLRCRGFSVPGEGASVHTVGGIAMDVTERKMLDRKLLDTAEKERQRVGVDLHDDLCQRLAAVLMKTGILQSALEKVESPQKNLASELAGDLSEATAIARRFARGLAPVSIEALGLTAALSDLGDFISGAFKIPCRVECSGADFECSAETSTHIFRVAQELASNAAKHSGCSWIEIGFETGAQEARLVIRHDGSLYDPQKNQGGGMGMHLVRQRLDALGTSLQATHSKDNGASLECVIPLPENIETPGSNNIL